MDGEVESDVIETPTTNHAGGIFVGCALASFAWIAVILIVVAIMAK